ncbi:MAG: hypothetical protein ACHQ49_13265 [Elusimicrobiota bacterium]
MSICSQDQAEFQSELAGSGCSCTLTCAGSCPLGQIGAPPGVLGIYTPGANLTLIAGETGQSFFTENYSQNNGNWIKEQAGLLSREPSTTGHEHERRRPSECVDEVRHNPTLGATCHDANGKLIVLSSHERHERHTRGSTAQEASDIGFPTYSKAPPPPATVDYTSVYNNLFASAESDADAASAAAAPAEASPTSAPPVSNDATQGTHCGDSFPFFNRVTTLCYTKPSYCWLATPNQKNQAVCASQP